MISPTIILIILNIGASLYAWNNKNIYSKWMMNPYLIHTDNQYYRFITSGFIHGDWMHLFFNMFALYSFGGALEYYLGNYVGAAYQIYFYALYFGALILSDIPTFLKKKDDERYNSLGASGAVAAVIFACIMVAPLSQIYLYFIPIPAFIFGFGYLAYSYYSGVKSIGGVNHDAHFYGAVVGVVSICLIQPDVLADFFKQIMNW